MLNDKHIIAIIPARGGSKGIPYKNLKQIGGISLLGHAIHTAQAVTWIDAIIVSSDCSEILKEAENFGIITHFRRPDILAEDTTAALPVWQHAWKTYESLVNKHYDIAIWLQPTSPLRRTKDVELTVQPIITGEADSALTVSRVPGHYVPEKLLVLNKDQAVRRYCDRGHTDLRQLHPAYYFRNGYCYVANKQAIFVEQEILSQKCKAIIIDRETVNIDHPVELEYAKFLYANYDKVT